MYQFFVEPTQVHKEQKMIHILGNDVNHARKALRMKEGEQARISVPATEEDYFCVIQEIRPDHIIARILYQDHESTELPAAITLFQGLPKGDKMDLIVEKAVELGAAEIVPVAMRNSVARYDAQKAAKKVSRWQAIAESAAKQSKRSTIPVIHTILNFKEAAAYGEGLDRLLVPYENEIGMTRTKAVIGGLTPTGSLGIFVGPEGGFDEAEIALIKDKAELLSLGKRILRTETAGMALLSILLYHLEE